MRYILEAAVRFNPDKRVILLGDEAIDRYTYLGVEHHKFADYDYGERIQYFDSVYRFVAGEERQYAFKEKFFFRRWFLMYNFVTQQEIESFWTFDSDTLIVTNLADEEYRFASVDCTEQCNGWCMNGYIRVRGVVAGYLDKISELFTRDEYLEQQQRDFVDNPKWGFTEMRAYWTYKHEEDVNSVHLGQIIDGATYDDCLFNAHDMETYPIQFKGRTTLKKIFLEPQGRIYVKHLPSQSYVRLNSLNLSWLPDVFFSRLLNHVKKQPHMTRSMADVDPAELRVLDVRPLILYYQLVERPFRWVQRRLTWQF